MKKKNESIDPIDPLEPVDAPKDMEVSQKRHRWEQQKLQDSKGNEGPHGIHWESKRPHRFLRYIALMSHINDLEPTYWVRKEHKE